MTVQGRTARFARALACLVVLLVGLFPGIAAAYVPPSPQGAVTDTSGKLSAADDSVLEAHIAAYRARTTNELAVLVVGSLGNESVDDVAYGAFNTWGVGKKGTDNGVLLVIAPNERKMRIETGKGVGDRLTDLESSHILRERVGPLLKQERFREAILAGLTGIETALDRNTGGVVPAAPAVPASTSRSAGTSPSHSGSAVVFLLPLIVLGFFAFVVLAVVILIVKAMRGTRRSGHGSSTWSSGDSSSSYSSSSSSDWSSGGSSGGSDFGGGGSSGGSDFGGGGGSDFGGGSSGGGGSSDSY